MAGNSKVFDVASPGSSKPETGSKPMVVGHKIMQDPTVKTVEAPSADKLTSRSEKTLKPITNADPKTETEIVANAEPKESEKESVIAADETTENITTDNETPEKSEDTEVASAPAVEASVTPETQPEEAAPTQTEEEKLQSKEELEVAREDKLQELIKSKEFYAPIEEATLSAFKTFMKTFVIVALVGIIALMLLIDAGIIDLGITLPFDFL